MKKCTLKAGRVNDIFRTQFSQFIKKNNFFKGLNVFLTNHFFSLIQFNIHEFSVIKSKIKLKFDNNKN